MVCSLHRLRNTLGALSLVFVLLNSAHGQTPIPVAAGALYNGVDDLTPPYLGTPKSVFVSGNYAYVASSGSNTLEIADVSVPTVPVHKSGIHNGGSPLLALPNSVVVSGNYAYVTSFGSNALEIVDITDPANPVHKSSIVDGAGGAALNQPVAVNVQGNYAYVVGPNSFSLEIIDISNPASPSHAGKLSVGLGNPINVFVSGNYAYVLCGGPNPFVIVDISAPATPTIVGTLANGAGGALLSNPLGIYVSGSYAYVTSQGSQSLEIIDVHIPSAPAHKGSIVSGTGGAKLSSPGPVVVSGNYAYVGNQNGNVDFEIINISNPAAPAHTTNLSLGSSLTTISALSVVGNYAYLTTQSSLQIIALFTPPPPIAIPATIPTSTSFNAHWNPIPNVTGYRVDVSADNFATFISGFNNSTQLLDSVTVTGLSAVSSYKYRVRAVNANGSSTDSNVITASTSPVIPAGTASTSVTSNGFTANWTASAGATNYFIDVSNNAAFIFPQYINFPSNGNNFFAVHYLDSGTLFYCRVRSSTALATSPSSATFTQMTLPVKPKSPVASSIGQTSFTAKWLTSFGASGYFVDVMDSQGTILTAYDNVSVTAPDTFLIVNNNIAAGTAYQFVVRATDAGGTTANSITKQVLTLPATPVGGPPDPSPTGTTFVATWTGVTGATGYNVTVATDVSFGVSSIIANYDNKNVGNVTSLSVNTLESGQVYYYIVSAYNASGSSPTSAPVSVTTATAVSQDIGFPSGGTLTDYRIVSIPSGTTASTTLTSASFIKNWRVMHYQNDAAGNVDVQNFTQITPGNGYWINSNLNPAPVMHVTGNFVAQATTMTLQPGWNQIGNPFNFSISWADVIASNSAVTGIGQVGDLYTYNVPAASATSPFQKYGGLLSNGGGFVNNANSSNVELTIPITVAHFTGRVASNRHAIESRDLSSREWFVPLSFKVGEMVNNLGGIGMHPDASNSIDRFDAIALPQFFTYVDMSSIHPEFFEPKFMSDVVTTSAQRDWTFTTASNSEDQQALLSWDNSQWGSNKAGLILFDVTGGILIDMRKHSQYSFTMDRNHTIRFFYSVDGTLSPDVTGMGQPYPNPFTSQITIPFVTSVANENVQINMYDITGKLVRSLVKGSQEPGYHEANWNGSDDQGNRLSEGIFIYRFTSSNSISKSGKVVLK